MKSNITLAVFLFSSHLLLAQRPTIVSFSPSSGPIGTSVTITGVNFNGTPGNNIVFFGAVKATVTTASASSLTVTVPASASYEPITITTGGLTASSAKPFNVTISGATNVLAASSFAPKNEYSSGKGTSCVATGDFDGDGKPDLVAVNDTSNTVSLFKNLSTNGTISLAPKIDYITGVRPYCVSVADLDGDGKLDLAVANGGGNSVSIFRNTSVQGADISFASKMDLLSGSLPYSLTIKDFDGDGRQDIAAANVGSNTISIFKNNSFPGAMSYAAKSDFVTGTSPYWIAAGDIDNDGNADLATANRGTISVLRNNSSPGNISFVGKTDFNSGPLYSIKIADLDDDEKLDLIVGGENNLVSVLLNTSPAPGNILFAQAKTLAVGGACFGVTISDIDGNAKPDIVFVNSFYSNTNSVSVLINKSSPGSLEFNQQIKFAVGTEPWVAAVVDLDGDNKPDIATANERSANISTIRNVLSGINIQSITPTTASSGTLVNIYGVNFFGVSAVSFGGIAAASFTVNSPTNIAAVVGAGGSGNVTVATGTGTASLSGFVFLPTPTITSFVPANAGTGDTLIISGTNFTGVTAVDFGGVSASYFKVDSSGKITAIMGTGASGSVSVNAPGGTAFLSGFIYDNTPVITSTDPIVAATGDTVLISGKHFNGTNAVSLGGVPVSSFTIVSPTNITAIVGAGGSGNVAVTNNAGTASFGGFTYLPPPAINSFSPSAAGKFETITIVGANFLNVLSVTFGDVPASSFTVNTSTSITAIVAGGSTGKVKVKTTGGVSSYPGFTYISLAVPVIQFISPLSGPIGTTVTIAGKNFSPVILNNIVYFGAVKAEILTASSAQLKVVVPASATYQAITVTTNDLTTYSRQFFNVTFRSDKIDFTTSSFVAKIDYKTGNSPTEVKTGDLDGDGKPDIVVANYSDQSISVLKNFSIKGSVIFDSKIDYLLPGRPGGSISISDLDGDGKPDIAVTCESNKVSIFKNTSTSGLISFAARIDFTTGDTPEGISTDDIDGDGKIDLVITNLHSNTVSVFKNRGAKGTVLFDPQIDFNTAVSPYYVCVNDFDGDGKPDIAVANYASNSVSVLKNISSNGAISFSTKIDFSVGISPYKMSIGDIDGDGDLDIATCNSHSASISLLKNTSEPGIFLFVNQTDLTTNITPYGVTIADMDGDDMPDVASADHSINLVSIFKNQSESGILSFSNKVDLVSGYSPSSITSCDFDGDSKPDLVTANFSSKTISIFKNSISEINPLKLCPPLANTFISFNFGGTNYQWQVNTGSGYTNIINNTNYAGANQVTLQLMNIPSAWYGYKYRRVTDGFNSDVFQLQFSDSWTGAANNAWENALNWYCGTVPDVNTDVIINSGTIIINSDVTIRSLKVNPGVSVTVSPGRKLTILH